MATTSSPTCTRSESPSAMVGRFVPSTLTTARSLDGLRPSSLASRDGAVGEHGLDLLRALDHVVVGDDHAVGRDHEPGAGRAAVVGAAVVDDRDDRGDVGLQDVGDVAGASDAVGRPHDHRRCAGAGSTRRRRRSSATMPAARPARRRAHRPPPPTQDAAPAPSGRAASARSRGAVSAAPRPGSRAPDAWRRGPDWCRSREPSPSVRRRPASAALAAVGSVGASDTDGPRIARNLTGRDVRSLSGYGNPNPGPHR